MAKTKTGWGASRANYRAELVAERLSGVPAESYTSAAMQRGIDLEPEARIAYEFLMDVDVKQVGFIDHPEIPMSGASPDGLVSTDGMVEFKCPNMATHIETILGAPVADKYLKQMQWQLACTGRQWVDFVSYDNRLPEPLRLFRQRIERDDEMIATLEAEITEFLSEVDEKVSALTELMQAA